MQVVKDFIGQTIECENVNTVNAVYPGSVRVYELNFAYNTPDLNIGIPVVDLQPGDSVLDAWAIATATFNGTGLRWDVGTYNPNAVYPTEGIMGSWWGGHGYLSDSSLEQIDWIQNDSISGSISGVAIQYTDGADVYPWQTPFVTFCTLKFVLSQNGASGGPAIGGTTGEGTLYVMVSKKN